MKLHNMGFLGMRNRIGYFKSQTGLMKNDFKCYRRKRCAISVEQVLIRLVEIIRV